MPPTMIGMQNHVRDLIKRNMWTPVKRPKMAANIAAAAIDGV